MDIEALIAAAKEIDRKAALSEERSKRFTELASMARKVEPHGVEHRRIIAESRQLSCTVVDFGDAISELRRALKSKPKNTRND